VLTFVRVSTWSIILLAAAWLAVAALSRWITTGTPREGDVFTGIVYRLVQVYARVLHGMSRRKVAWAHVPVAGPLIVVCNHTAGADPLLVQSVVVPEIRWMMARDMMLASCDRVWEWLSIIGVDANARGDTRSLREAIRHVEAGGVLGIFPEGGIERPPGRLRPFMAGAGLVIAKTGVPVLPVFITDTPQAPQAWQSLWRTSRAKVTLGPIMRFERTSKPDAIVRELRAWFVATSGWPDESTISA
jgi:1-acyl-sn-glycerol-3-phosphate acyltransferase